MTVRTAFFHWILAPVVLGLLGCGTRTGVAAPGSARATLAIANVTVVDVRTGDVRRGRTILIRGDTIVGVVDGTDAPNASRVVDANGLFAIPGLWDMHVHVLWDDSIAQALLPRFVAAGVTGLRDMGGTAKGVAHARELEQADPATPRIVAAGPILDGPQPVDPSISFAVADSADAVAAVDSLARLGADFVKVYTLLPPDAFHAAAARAAELGLPVVGHLPWQVDLADALRAGMRSIEHLREEIDLFCRSSDSLSCGVVDDILRERAVWQTPTLVVLEAKTRMRDPAFASAPAVAAMPEVLQQLWTSIRESKLDRDEAYWAEQDARWADALWLTRRFHERGVPILAGTDTPVLFTYPGESLHRELELLVEAGLTPVDALRTATLEPARYLDAADRFGAIDTGYAADVVLLRANPLTDIAATREVAGVVLRGRWVARTTTED